MSLLTALIAVAASFLGFLFSVVTAVFVGLVNILIWTYTYFVTISSFIVALAARRQLVRVVLIVTVTSIILGIPASIDVNLVMKPIDFVAEGPSRQVFEGLSKFGIVNAIGVSDWLGPRYNTVVAYFFVRFDLFKADAIDLYNGIAATADYFRLLESPRILWKLTSSFVGYFWMSKSAGGKTDFFQDLSFDQHFFKFTKTPPGDPSKYETDPEFGAFPQIDTTGPLYYLRNFVFDFVNVLQGAGDIIMTKVSELAFPGQKFFRSFYVVVDSPESFWGQLADWLTKTISFLTGESFYPKEFTVAQVDAQATPKSVQPSRFDNQKYTARLLRILALIPRFISLIVIHSTTIRYPVPLGAVLGTGVELIKTKLIGVPGVDLFLDPALTAVTNPVILSKSKYACDTLLKMKNEVLASFATVIICSTSGGIFKGTLPLSDGDPPGSEYQCVLWDGIVELGVNHRIDYVFEAYRIVPGIAQYIEDPTGVLTLAQDTAVDIYKEVIRPIVRIIYAYVYFIGTVFYPQCSTFFASEYLKLELSSELITILDYIYQPLTCDGGVNLAVVDPLTCFITINSRASFDPSFWRFLCRVVDSAATVFALAGPQYKCDNSRKRNLASEAFANDSPQPQLGWSTYFHLQSMFAASETRKAFDALHYCLFANDSSASITCARDTCALAPCVEEMLDCIANRAPADNQWRLMFDTKNGTNVLFRNALTVSLNLHDLLSGCSDSYVYRAYSAIKETGDYVRSYVASWVMLVGDFVPAYFHCMDKLREAKNNGTVAEDDNMEFAYCIGLKTRPPKPSRKRSFSERTNGSTTQSTVTQADDEWNALLNQNGIFANTTWCGHRLHERGIVVDDVAITDSLSIDHLMFRVCSFQLAFGTRARLAKTTTHSIEDFLGGWTGPTALLESLDNFGDEHMRLVDSALPREIPKLGLREQNNTQNTTQSPTERIVMFAQALEQLMPSIEIFATAFHLYADLHDHVATTLTTPEEKAEMSHRLLLHHLGLQEESLQKRSELKLHKTNDPRRSELVVGSEQRKRNFANAVRKLDLRISVLQEFGNNLYFAGRYPMATVMEQQQDEVEMEVKIDRTNDRTTPLLSIRPLTEKKNFEWSLVALSDIGMVLDSLSAETNDNAQRKQTLVSAVSAFRNLRSALQTRDRYIEGAEQTRSGRAAVHYASVVVTCLFRIFNRRWVLEGYPQYHTGAMFAEILGGQRRQLQDIPAWIDGKKNYLSGIGFVENDVYEAYMSNAKTERERAKLLYSGFDAKERLVDITLFSVKRAKLWHAERLVELEKKRSALEETTATATIRYETQKQTIVSKVLKKHVNFAKRSSFLVRHNLHGEDDCLHLVAPQWWQHREQAALANTTESRRRFNVIASFEAGQFLAGLDEILQFFGAPANTLETALIQAETAVTNFFATTNDPLYFDNLAATISAYFVSIACDVNQDVRLSGTGTYTVFCLPYYPEKLFNWYEFFPKDRNKPLLGYFEDAGYIRWPTALIDVDCPTQRNPTAQCPIEPPRPLLLQNPQNTPLDQFETINGETATTYPIDTSSWFGNTCFTDWCKIDVTSRPACPLFDYCERTYKQPSTFGFVNGAQNFIVWSNDIRVVYNNVIANDSLLSKRFWALGILFLLLAFSDLVYFPLICITIPSPITAYLAAAIFIIVEFFVLQTPETCSVVLIYLWIWLETVELVAWLQFIPLIVHLFALKYYGFSFLTPIFNFLPQLFPDTLLATILNFLSGFTFFNPIYDVSNLAAYASSITAAQAAYPASEINNVLSLQTFYNAELLLVEVLAISALTIYLFGAALAFLSAFLPLLSVFTALFNSIISFFTSLNVVSIANDVEDNEVDQTIKTLRLQRRIEQLELRK